MMANTIPDITIVHTEYSDIYTLTGIDIGTQILIQNKEESEMIIQYKPTQPNASSKDGVILEPRGSMLVESGPSPC